METVHQGSDLTLHISQKHWHSRHI